MDFFIAILPIAVLIYVMTQKHPWPSHIALPAMAALVYILSLAYFSRDPNLVNATVLNGALSALTPVSIIGGAILLSLTLRRFGAERLLSQWLHGITQNRVAQLMIIGWAFAFMIEGASGFGTPAAIAAPLLVGLGFEPIRVATLALIMNSVPVTFGAVGTPLGFGLSPLGLSASELLAVSWKSALVNSAAALIVPVIALRFAVGWDLIRRNLAYIYLSIAGCVVPYLFLARYNWEFPSLIGGAAGLALSVVFAKYRVGLAGPADETTTSGDPLGARQLAQAFLPYALLIAILVVTRLPQLPLRSWLNAESPVWEASLGTLGQFSVSAGLVLTLRSILGANSTWTYHALFVPALIPFMVVILLCIPLLHIDRPTFRAVAVDTTRRLIHPAITLVGALIMVQLMMIGDDTAKTLIIGRTLARHLGRAWPLCASWLGAIGSFFAGSATVSNLTFGGIQQSIAQTLGFDPGWILALQCAGSAMGNMVSINNIIAVGSIIGLENQEGSILRRTAIALVAYGLIAGLIGMAWA